MTPSRRRVTVLLLWSCLIATAGVMAWAVIDRGNGMIVRPDELSALIDRADRLVVRPDPMQGQATLFESTRRGDLDALKRAARVVRPDEEFHCMCLGRPAIELYAGDARIGRITHHHGVSLRCDLWKSDAPLADREAMLRWFDDRGIREPRAEYEEGRARDRQARADRARWLAEMPPALATMREQALVDGDDSDVAELRHALQAAVPDRAEQIMSLFHWYGSGVGPWSGVPGYEQVPERMLLEYPTAELLAAIERRPLSAPETEGVARFFGGWNFSRKRPKDLSLLSPQLKSRLWEHVKSTSDDDKRRRAERAFAA